jgi:hypothetical protein
MKRQGFFTGRRVGAVLATLAAPVVAFLFFVDLAFCADNASCGPSRTALFWFEVLVLLAVVIAINVAAWRSPKRPVK